MVQCRQHVVGQQHAVECSVVQEVLLLQVGLFSYGAVSTLCQIWTYITDPQRPIQERPTTFRTQRKCTCGPMRLASNVLPPVYPILLKCRRAGIAFTLFLHRAGRSAPCSVGTLFQLHLHIYIYIYLYQLTTYSFPSCRVNRYLQYHSIALQVCIRCVVQTSTSKWCLHLGRYASIFVSPLLLSVVDIAVCSLAPSLLCSLARLLFPLLQMQ